MNPRIIYIFLSILISGILFLSCQQNNEYHPTISKEILEKVHNGDSEAIEHLKTLASEGNINAITELGIYYYNNGKTYKAITQLKKAAELNCPKAQYLLGVCYYRGTGVSQDFSKAVKYFRTAANQEYPDAQHAIGICYFYGDGVTKNQTKAAEWWERASTQGFAQAQHDLSFCYRNGIGVKRNDSIADEWQRRYINASEQ